MIRAARALAAALALSCASAGAPPGGPPRTTPPEIIGISPDSGATSVDIKSVEFKFDEVVSDRPAGAGATLDQLFLVSPRDGAPNVSWHRDRITIRPRRGFRANTAYRVTMLPGLADLRGNIRREGASILFSTGATFPAFGIVGTTFDWEAQKPVSGAYVEAISRADTTLVFVSASDSAGRYDVGPLPAGTYLVRASIDQNGNRAIDAREKWDSVTTTVTTTRPNVELDLIERDTLAAAIVSVSVDDSVTLRVAFDKALSPSLALLPAQFRIQRADSSLLQIADVQWVSVFQRAKAVADSIQRAAADTARRPAVPPAAAPPAAAPGRTPPPPPKPRTLPPEREIVLRVSPSTPLTPGRYQLFATGLTNLTGRSGELRRGFVVAPPAPRDTTRRSPADSTRRPPPRHR